MEDTKELTYNTKEPTEKTKEPVHTTKELINLSHQGDKAARDTLVLENMGLVYSISRRFLGRGYELEDLNQIGTIGLIKAIDKFNSEYDVQFSTYAVPMIAGEIKRFLRDDGMIKVSRSIKENGYKLKKIADQIMASKGREATALELVKESNLSIEEVVMALEANTDVESIYKTVYQGDGSEVYLLDKISQEKSVTYLQESCDNDRLIESMLLTELLDGLDEMEKNIIILRYFKENTQSVVANKLGISQVQVSRMEKKILYKLRQNLE